MLGCFTTAILGIREKMPITGPRFFSEKRVAISDPKKSRKGIVMLLLKYSSVLSAGTYALCCWLRTVLGLSSTELISSATSLTSA